MDKNPNTEEMLAARDRLRAALDDFDDDAAFAFNETGERSDFWTDIEVNVNDLRTILAEQAHAAKDSPTPEADGFVMALAREVAVSHNGPTYWLSMNDNGRDYWRQRVERNIADARKAVEGGFAADPVSPLAMVAEAARARAADCATWHELKGQEYRFAHKGEHASTHEEWCDAIRTLLTPHHHEAGGAPGRDDLRHMLKDAFVSGCCAVLTWTNSGMPQDDLDEAGYDYAAKVLPVSHPPSDQQGREQVIGELCEALEPFATYRGSDQFLASDAPDNGLCIAVSFTAGNFRKARATYEKARSAANVG